ncbi:transposase [Patescibacteria group bacterium]|nr:transposase [Patescibacteria group bacterium]
MARKNSVKTYVKDGYYHIYNRGVGKQDIFLDVADYNKFQYYLESYLSPPPDPKELIKTFTLKDGVFKGISRQPKNYHQQINLTAYCLMPNHFHLLLQQKDFMSMKEFLHSLSIRYAMYFNKKYDRVGPLFQGRYKASLVGDDRYLL